MADITVILRGAKGESLTVKELPRFEMIRDADAVCDAVSFTFLYENNPFEIAEVTVRFDNKTVFDGICDKQRFSANEKGFEVYCYARSAAALLLDNEAKPATYNAPSVNVLFHSEAKRFGFVNALPELCSKYAYTVGKGTSCYGAINTFVKTLTSKNVLVNSDKELFIPDGNGTVNADSETVLGESHCINRSKPITRIDYKTDGDTAYFRHYKSRFLDDRGIKRSRITDVSSLPMWQREYVLKDTMTQSAKDYYEAQYIIDGLHFFELYDRLVSEHSGISPADNYRLCRTVITQNESGAQTRLVFRKELELKEINYVAE